MVRARRLTAASTPLSKFIEWATQDLSADLGRRLRQLEADVAFGAATLRPEACSQDESKLLRREQQVHGALSALRGLLSDFLRTGPPFAPTSGAAISAETAAS